MADAAGVEDALLEADGREVAGAEHAMIPTVPLPDLPPWFQHRLAEIEAVRVRIQDLLKAAIEICNFHTTVQGICFGITMTAPLIRSCSSAWYVTIFAASVGVPAVFFMVAIAVRISRLMDAYDSLRKDFENIQGNVTREYPNTFLQARYMGILCSVDGDAKWKRNLAIVLTLCCFIVFTLLVLIGPHLFFCRKSPLSAE